MTGKALFLKDRRNGFAVRTLLTKIRQVFTILVFLVSLLGASTTLAKAETLNVTDNFAVNLQSVEYTITASAGVNGSITPSGAVIVSEAGNQSFTITPDTGYGVLDVLVDGVSVGQDTSYEFTNVQANHTIAASFAAAPGEVTLISPVGNIGNEYEPTYVWQKVENATWYQLAVKDPTGLDHQVWLEAALYCDVSECSVTSTPTTGGSYLWWVQAWDDVFGPESDQIAFNIEPDTTITSSPPNPSSSAIATFEFESDDEGIGGGALFECSLDEGSFVSCTSPKEYTGLGSGSHTFEVRAVSYGIPDPTPASYTWTINILPTCYALTLNHTGQGSDPVADPVNSTGCATGQYVAGAAIDLSGAVPAAGWAISGWSGTDVNGSTANTNTVTMPAGAHTAGVTYSQSEYTLTVNAAHGTVTRTPDQAAYHYGDEVTLSVVADPGWTFTGWTPELTENKVTILGNTSVTANFSQIEYTLTTSIVGSGTVNRNNPGPYHYNDVVQLTAVPAAGWSFSAWSGNLTGNANPANITIDGNKSITATFTQDQYTLTVTVVGNGSVTTDVAGPYHYGDDVELTAVPDLGWTFSAWSGNLTGSANPATITMDSNKSVTATFVDVTNPTVSSIVRADGDPTSAASVDFTVTFSEPVTDVDADDFVPAIGGEIEGAEITDVVPVDACTGSMYCDIYTVTVDTGIENGTLGLDVALDATISNSSGNALAHQLFAPDEEYTVEKPLTLLSPANGETLLYRRPTFDWTSVQGATNYKIVASKSSTFSTVLWKVNTTTNTYTPPADLPAGKVIYWHVRAKVGGVWGAWSETWSFTTAKPPSVPVLVLPANKALTKDYKPLLDWNDSTIPSGGAAFDHYQVQVSVDKAFSDPLSIDASDVTISSYTPATDLDANTKYFWRVRSFNVDGQYSSWSTVWSFFTALLPPGNLTPTGGEMVGNRKPLLDWDAVDGASGYTLQISTSDSFSTLLVNTPVAADTFTPGTNLPANTLLYWRVRATGTNGPSRWTTESFHTP